MRVVNIATFTKLSQTLGSLLKRAELAEPLFAQTAISEDFRKAISGVVEAWTAWLEPLGFVIALDSVADMGRLADKPTATAGENTDLIKQFAGRLHSELKHTLFLAIRREDASLYQHLHLFGLEIETSFPSTPYDIEEAGTCLVLDRYTACVFHLTRVLQAGLYALAVDVGVDPADRNWGRVIGDIEKAIKTQRTQGHGPTATLDEREAWKRQKEFYAGATMHFDHMLEAFRNGAIHKTGKEYSPEKARSLLEHTRDFMQHLSANGLRELS